MIGELVGMMELDITGGYTTTITAASTFILEANNKSLPVFEIGSWVEIYADNYFIFAGYVTCSATYRLELQSAFERLFQFTQWLESGPGAITVAGQQIHDITDLLQVCSNS